MHKSSDPAPSSPASVPRKVVVREVPIELCQFIKFGGVTESGGEAKQLINEGLVLLNGAIETQKRKKLAIGDVVEVRGQTLIVDLKEGRGRSG